MNIESKSALVSVVIPFFQRDKGLLGKCVKSILEQKNYDNFQVIIVDDGSPVSATGELDEILKKTDKVSVIFQDNAGPGAARNRGLDNLPANTKYVAFLDSDDWWEETFLSDAVTALELGHDLFFANSQRFGFDETRFEWETNKKINLDASQHELVNQARQLYKFKDNFFNFALVRSNIISTSAMAYRLNCSHDLRFSTKLFNGQDRLFKLSLCQRIDKVAFSPRVLVQEEEGVNIFDSAKWGTAKSLVLISNYIKLSKCILQELELDGKQKKQVHQKLVESRYSMVANILHLLKSGVRFDWSLVIMTIKEDPAFLLYIIPNLFKVVTGKFH